MSISPQSGARGLDRLRWLKYNTVMQRQNTFNLRFNAAKNKVRAANMATPGIFPLKLDW